MIFFCCFLLSRTFFLVGTSLVFFLCDLKWLKKAVRNKLNSFSTIFLSTSIFFQKVTPTIGKLTMCFHTLDTLRIIFSIWKLFQKDVLLSSLIFFCLLLEHFSLQSNSTKTTCHVCGLWKWKCVLDSQLYLVKLNKLQFNVCK